MFHVWHHVACDLEMQTIIFHLPLKIIGHGLSLEKNDHRNLSMKCERWTFALPFTKHSSNVLRPVAPGTPWSHH
jgi:hypothetical protein